MSSQVQYLQSLCKLSYITQRIFLYLIFQGFCGKSEGDEDEQAAEDEDAEKPEGEAAEEDEKPDGEEKDEAEGEAKEGGEQKVQADAPAESAPAGERPTAAQQLDMP